jgi:hypothetical protein
MITKIANITFAALAESLARFVKPKIAAINEIIKNNNVQYIMMTSASQKKTLAAADTRRMRSDNGRRVSTL